MSFEHERPDAASKPVQPSPKRDELEHLRRGIAAYRAHVARVERNGEFSTRLVEQNVGLVHAWEREDSRR